MTTIKSLLKQILTKHGEVTYLLRDYIHRQDCMMRNQERRDEFYQLELKKLYEKRKKGRKCMRKL